MAAHPTAEFDLEDETMRRLLFWVTVISGTTVAYLMYKRGAPVGEIAEDALMHPLSSLKRELLPGA